MRLVLWSPADDCGDAEALVARGFGAGLGDMVVDFDRSLNTVLSAVLQVCLSAGDGASFGGAEVAGWTVLKRRQGLIAVSVATHGPLRKLAMDCSGEDCGAKLDLDLDLTSLKQDWRVESIAFRGARLRLPRPSDLAKSRGSGDEARQLARQLLEGKVPEADDWEAEAEEALGQADRLADMELHAECPECRRPVVMPLMLEEMLVGELAGETARLMDEVHLLAMTYHWTEPDIIALPENRRRHYLARIQEGWAA